MSNKAACCEVLVLRIRLCLRINKKEKNYTFYGGSFKGNHCHRYMKIQNLLKADWTHYHYTNRAAYIRHSSGEEDFYFLVQWGVMGTRIPLMKSMSKVHDIDCEKEDHCKENVAQEHQQGLY